MTLENDRYTYRVTWSQKDGEYLSSCTEFPALSSLAASHALALEGIQGIVAAAVEKLRTAGKAIPEPISSKTFSGKLRIQMKPELHRRLATQAAENGVSLKQLARSKLNR